MLSSVEACGQTRTHPSTRTRVTLNSIQGLVAAKKPDAG